MNAPLPKGHSSNVAEHAAQMTHGPAQAWDQDCWAEVTSATPSGPADGMGDDGLSPWALVEFVTQRYHGTQ